MKVSESKAKSDRHELCEHIESILDQMGIVLAYHADKVREYYYSEKEITGNEDLLKYFDDFLSQANAIDPENPSMLFIYNAHNEFMKLLSPLFYRTPQVPKNHLIYINKKEGKPDSDFFKSIKSKLPLTIVNEEDDEDKYAFSLATVAHQIGHNIYRHVDGLKTKLENKIISAFEDNTQFLDCLNMIYPHLTIESFHCPGIMYSSVHLSSEIEQHMLRSLQQFYPERGYKYETLYEKGEVKIQFLKYLWLHWLENCFADIISLVLLDASAILSYMHKYKFFDYSITNRNHSLEIFSEKNLIENFYGLKKSYPLYIRFRFLVSALQYIEKTLARTTPLGGMLKEKLQPVINILLEKKGITGEKLETYRFDAYFGDKESLFSIGIEFVENMQNFIIPKIFDAIDEFVDPQQKKGKMAWLKDTAFKDWEVREVDDLIFKLLMKSEVPQIHKYRHIIAAGGFCFDLFPRSALKINNKILNVSRPELSNAENDNANPPSLICLDYYFKCEKYWDWHFFSQDVETLIQEYGDNHPGLKVLLLGLSSQYKISDENYDQIMEKLNAFRKQLDGDKEKNLAKRINVLLYHYSGLKKVRQFNASLEEDIIKQFDQGRIQKRILGTIFEHPDFHNVLDTLVEGNIISHEYINYLEDILLKGSPTDLKILIEKDTTSDYISRFLLYEWGALFNERGYSEKVNLWEQNRSQTWEIHQEAWKGKIMGVIAKKLFTWIYNNLKPQEFESENANTFSLIKEWLFLLDKPLKSLNRYNLLPSQRLERIKALSVKIDEQIFANMKASPSRARAYEKEIKKVIKETCTETLIWINYKNVRYMYNKLVKKC